MSTYAEEIARNTNVIDSIGMRSICLPWMFASMALVYLHVFGHGELIREMKPADIKNLNHYGDYLAFSDFVNWLYDQEAEEGEWYTPENVFDKWNEFVKQQDGGAR